MIHGLFFKVSLLNEHLTRSVEHRLGCVETDALDGVDNPLVDLVDKLVEVDVLFLFVAVNLAEHVDGVLGEHRRQLDVQTSTADGQAHLLWLEEHLCLVVLLVDVDA